MASSDLETWFGVVTNKPIHCEYEISSTGRLRNKATEYVRRPQVSPIGHSHVSVRGRPKSKHFKLYVHQLVMAAFNGPPPNDGQKWEIDHFKQHKDERGALDNSATNLRWVTRSGNSNNKGKQRRNRSRAFSSKYKGVSWDRRDRRWIATLWVNRKRVLSKYFKKESEARDAYDAACMRLNVECALTNLQMFGAEQLAIWDAEEAAALL